MDPKDQDDIIKKVKEAGKGDDQTHQPDNELAGSADTSEVPENGDNLPDENDDEPKIGEDPIAESEGFILAKPKKLSIFAPEGSDEAKWKESIKKKLKESFNQENKMTNPIITPKPVTKPQVKPVITPKPSRRNKPFNPVVPAVNPAPKADISVHEIDLVGNKIHPKIYHESFNSAIQAAKKYAENCGYMVNPDDWFNEVQNNGDKPKMGVTKKYKIELLKDGKPQKKCLYFEIGELYNQYELNVYIN